MGENTYSLFIFALQISIFCYISIIYNAFKKEKDPLIPIYRDLLQPIECTGYSGVVVVVIVPSVEVLKYNVLQHEDVHFTFFDFTIDSSVISAWGVIEHTIAWSLPECGHMHDFYKHKFKKKKERKEIVFKEE